MHQISKEPRLKLSKTGEERERFGKSREINQELNFIDRRRRKMKWVNKGKPIIYWQQKLKKKKTENENRERWPTEEEVRLKLWIPRRSNKRKLRKEANDGIDRDGLANFWLECFFIFFSIFLPPPKFFSQCHVDLSFVETFKVGRPSAPGT